MRDRLIELLTGGQPPFNALNPVCISVLADYLLENGVIVPPCKVGETLYFLYDRTYANRPDSTPRIYETNQWYFDVDEKGISILPRSIHGYKGKHHYYLGETVFRAREEAEKALGKLQANYEQVKEGTE